MADDNELSISIPKAGTKLKVDLSKIPEDMIVWLLGEGLKVALNTKMTKIATKDLEGEELEAAKSKARAQAEENLELIYSGKPTKRATGTASKGVPAAVKTEAMRLARIEVKDTLRAAGMAPSKVEASVITEAAKRLLESKPLILEQAAANIAARDSNKVIKLPMDKDAAKAEAKALAAALGIVAESPKLVAKAEKDKAERKSGLSATQASKVAARKTPARGQTAVH